MFNKENHKLSLSGRTNSPSWGEISKEGNIYQTYSGLKSTHVT